MELADVLERWPGPLTLVLEVQALSAPHCDLLDTDFKSLARLPARVDRMYLREEWGEVYESFPVLATGP